MVADLEFLGELFEPVGRVDFRRMFSGAGVYRDGLIFALVIDDIVYLKADELNRPAFETEGQAPFSYSHRNGKRVVTSYWRIPDRLLDDPEELRQWALAAVEASRRALAAKAEKPRRKKAP